MVSSSEIYIEPLVVLPVAALYLPVMSGSIGTDKLMPDSMFLQTFLEKRWFIPVSGKAVGKLRAIVRLDTFNLTGKSLDKVFHKLCRRIGTVFFKSLYKTPSGILINGSVLEKLLPDDLAVFEAGGGNKFDVHLNTLPRVVHLFRGFGNIFGVRRMDRHNSLFSEEAVKSGNGAGITSLPELDPKDYQAGIRIAASHIVDEFDFLRSMLVGMMVRSSGTIA